MKRLFISGISLILLTVPTTASASRITYEHSNPTMNSRNCHANLLLPYLNQVKLPLNKQGIDLALHGHHLVVTIQSRSHITKHSQEASVDALIHSAKQYAKQDGSLLKVHVKES